jgi:hypothetical protein
MYGDRSLHVQESEGVRDLVNLLTDDAQGVVLLRNSSAETSLRTLWLEPLADVVPVSHRLSRGC